MLNPSIIEIVTDNMVQTSLLLRSTQPFIVQWSIDEYQPVSRLRVMRFATSRFVTHVAMAGKTVLSRMHESFLATLW